MEENSLMIFKSEQFGEIRATEINGESYLVGKDVVEALGYDLKGNSYSKYVKQYSDEEDYILLNKSYIENEKVHNRLIQNIDYSELGRKGGYLINESGFYALVFGSELTEAKEFKRWVTKEVLPSIRKHGAYITEKTLDEMLADPDNMIKVLTTLKEEKEKNTKLESDIVTMLPKVEQYDSLMNSHDLLSMNETAKSIGVGRNDLFNLLRKKSILMSDKKNKKDHNVPYQKYINSKYFTVVEHEIMGETQPQTFVSTKGLEWLSKKLSKDWKDELKNIKKEIIENNKNNKAS